MIDELARAIDGLYDTFASYGRPTWVEGCACCWHGEPIDDRDSRFGQRGAVRIPAPGGVRPLRQVGADELQPIAADVPLTCGDLTVLKHYLPRILEIAVTVGFDHPDLEIVFERLDDGPGLGSACWVDWPPAERMALRTFFESFGIDRLAAVCDDDHWVDDALCAIGVVDPDFEWYLEEWLRFRSETAAEHLSRFLHLNAEDLTQGALWNAYWDSRPPADANRAKVVAWTRSDATLDLIAAAIERARTPAEADALTACRRRTP